MTPKHIDIIPILRDNGSFSANELELTNQFSGVGEDVYTLACDVNTSMLAAKAEALMRELGLWVRKEATQDERESVARTLRFGSFVENGYTHWLCLMPINDGDKWFGRQSFVFHVEHENPSELVFEDPNYERPDEYRAVPNTTYTANFTLDQLETLKIDVQLDGKFPIWHLLCFFQTRCDDHFWEAIQLIQNAGGKFETVGF